VERTLSYFLNMFKDGPHGRAIPQRATSEETRRRIVETALTLFRERGFDETTIRDIASEAGLSLGAAYYYFKSKEAIVAAYYDYVQTEHQLRARETFARAGDLRSRLRGAIHTKIDIVKDSGVVAQEYKGNPGHTLRWTPTIEDATAKYFFVRIWTIGGGDAPDADPTKPMAWLAPVWTGR